MQINLITYRIYGNKKKWTQTFPYCNHSNKKINEPTLTTCCIYDNTKNG
jgi:hypothetical protein